MFAMGVSRALFVSMLVFTSLCSRAARSEPVTAPVEVEVGLYLMNVGKFEIATGSFTADFYLTLSSTTDMGDPRLEFLNGRATSTDILLDTPTEKQMRIQANLMTSLNLSRFPLDSHDLPIVLESATRKDTELVLKRGPKEGIDPAVVFVGWNLLGFTAEVAPHEYPVFGERFSTYTYRIQIQRLLFTSTMKTFVPVFVFLLITFCALIVGTEKLDSRVSMTTAMLIASVMFHLSITNQLPPASSLTLADKVMIATYLTIGVSLLASVLMMRHMQADRVDAARALRRRAFTFVPGFALAAYTIVVLAVR